MSFINRPSHHPKGYGKTKTKYFVYHPRKYGIATLMRIGLRVRGWQFLIHHFWPHSEDEYHDHPWAFRTFVLWGSYVDESLNVDGTVTRDRLRFGSTRFRPAIHAHKTSCTGNTWTFVITRPKERKWCKGTPESWVCDGEVEDFDATRGMVKV